jgi:outer membrane protein assembly factor BamB
MQMAKAEIQSTLNVQLLSHGDGQVSLTNLTHTSANAAKLVIPSNAQQGSNCMVLYPYNKTLNSLQSFQIYALYTNATPRLVIQLDTNGDYLADLVLLSDYQILSNASWQIIQGGQRWGWTEATPDLGAYGKNWNSSSYWQIIYGNATVLSVGAVLEYWAVKDSNGIDQPLYADEAIINKVTYNIATPIQPTNKFTFDDWVMYRHDPQRSGTSSSPAYDCNLLWRFNTGDKIRSSPAIVNGVVYQGANNGVFYALNETTGSIIWQCAAASSGVESSPAVVNGVVYVGYLWDGHNGYVVALDASTGALIWQFSTNSGIESSPAVVNGIVYIGSYLGYIYALNSANGVLIWSYSTGSSTYSSPAIYNGVLYVGADDGSLYAINATNGNFIWSHQTGSPVYASPIVIDDTVYANSDNGAVYALSATDGSEIWHANIGVGDHADASPAVAGGIAYFVARTGLYAFNATNGMQIWCFASPYSPRQSAGYVYSSPAVANDLVYFSSCDGYTFALNAKDSSIVWSYKTGNFVFASPAIANGAVYVGSYDGYLYALGDLFTPRAPTLTKTPQSTPTTTPIPTPTTTVSPSPSSVSTSQQTIDSTSTPGPIPTQTPLPPQISVDHPESKSVAVDATQNEILNWIILGAIIISAAIALISLFTIFKENTEDPKLTSPFKIEKKR